jgi:uncharacterized protein (TIGR02246 family)
MKAGAHSHPDPHERARLQHEQAGWDRKDEEWKRRHAPVPGGAVVVRFPRVDGEDATVGENRGTRYENEQIQTEFEASAVSTARLPCWVQSSMLRTPGGEMRRLAVVVSIAAALGMMGIVQGQGKTDPTLNKLAAEFEAAFNAGDAAKVASMYAEDGVVMPPNEPMVKGRSAIEAALKKEMAKGKVTLKLSPFHSAITGDSAHEAGTVTVKLPDGRTVNEKYVVVYKRVGNEWKIAYDIWNSDTPPPPK